MRVRDFLPQRTFGFLARTKLQLLLWFGRTCTFYPPNTYKLLKTSLRFHADTSHSLLSWGSF